MLPEAAVEMVAEVVLEEVVIWHVKLRWQLSGILLAALLKILHIGTAKKRRHIMENCNKGDVQWRIN